MAISIRDRFDGDKDPGVAEFKAPEGIEEGGYDYSDSLTSLVEDGEIPDWVDLPSEKDLEGYEDEDDEEDVPVDWSSFPEEDDEEGDGGSIDWSSFAEDDDEVLDCVEDENEGEEPEGNGERSDESEVEEPENEGTE